jgi:hypothetical protein
MVYNNNMQPMSDILKLKEKPKTLIYNSYYRSGNVFLSHLTRFILNVGHTTNHNPILYSDTENQYVTMFRNPYDCISSLIVKRRVDSKSEIPELYDPSNNSLESEIQLLCEEYMEYVRLAKENADKIYIGNFDAMIKDPYTEIKNIAKFFSLEVRKEIFEINDLSFLYDEVLKELNETPGPNGEENLMSPHDGHLPREKSKSRLAVEQYVNNSSLLKECYEAYLNIPYTKI